MGLNSIDWARYPQQQLHHHHLHYQRRRQKQRAAAGVETAGRLGGVNQKLGTKPEGAAVTAELYVFFEEPGLTHARTHTHTHTRAI